MTPRTIADSATQAGQDHLDPVAQAKLAGLRYGTDTQPGYKRVVRGKRTLFLGLEGQPVNDERELKRIAALVIPPAWTNVWIAARHTSHLQATGRDARGRKQYRYHDRWRDVRDETKYNRLLQFGDALPTIRQRVETDLALPGLPREKMLATVVRLLETTLIRIGNEEYARSNDSYGLTTMRDDHVDVGGSNVRFTFRGKSGKEHEIDTRDRRLATIVKRSRDLPGQTLFQYVDEEGDSHPIDSGDVNDYLHQLTGESFTAKDFRTWHATVLAARQFLIAEPAEGESARKHVVVEVVAAVAERLGNTPAVCRKSYIHPRVIERYLDGSLDDLARSLIAEPPETVQYPVSEDERLIIALLREEQSAALRS